MLAKLNFEPMLSHTLFVRLNQVCAVFLSLLHDASVTNLLRLRASTTWLQLLLLTTKIRKMYMDDAILLMGNICD